jgi:hypothetical protein
MWKDETGLSSLAKVHDDLILFASISKEFTLGFKKNRQEKVFDENFRFSN